MQKFPDCIKVWYIFDQDIPGRWYVHLEDVDTGKMFAWGQSGSSNSFELYLTIEGKEVIHNFTVYDHNPSYALTSLIESEYEDFVEQYNNPN